MTIKPMNSRWAGIRIGILSLFDLRGAWTANQIRSMMPPPKKTGSFNDAFMRGATLASSPTSKSSSHK